MPEPTPGQVVEPQATIPTPAEPEPKQGGESDIELLKTQMADVLKQNEIFKNEISTRDKKITELQKKDMTEKEKLQLEKKELIENVTKTKLDLVKQKLSLDDGFEALLGSNIEQIDANAELLKQFSTKILEAKTAEIESLKSELAKYKANTGDPGKGNGVPNDIDAQITEAKKNGNAALATKLYLQKISKTD